jgi:hypothetical protein
MIKIIARCAIAAVVVCATATALAQDAREPWTWRATIYAWLPSIHSSTQAFDVPSGSISTEVNPDSYLSHLKFVLMGTLEARRGPWSFVADALYLHMGDVKTRVKTITGPAGIIAIPLQASAETDTQGFIGTLAAGYSIAQSPDSPADVFAGVRHAHVKASLDWDFGAPAPPISQSGHAETSKTLTDVIVGVRGRAALGGSWFVPYHLDLGAGSSRFTWQALAGIGYRYPWGDVTLAYRHLAYDFESDRPISDLRFSGPQLGVSFRF